MASVEALCRDVAAKRGNVKGGGEGPTASEYTEVWNAYVRYLKSCLEQKRGLHLHSFCKVGWVLTKKRPNSPPEYRPFFQLTEQFCRACSMTPEGIRKHLKPPPGELSQLEDFNFSKASIKFSGNLNKDQVFSGLRSLVQRLAEMLSEGKDVQLVFGDVGRLVVKGADKEPMFSFSQEVLATEGMDAPIAADMPQAAPSGAAAFRKDAPAEALGLGIRGSAPAAQAAALPEEPSRYFASIPEEDPMPHHAAPRTPAARPLSRGASAPSLTPPSSGGGGSPTGSLTNAQYKKEVAYKEAMDRHICAMEAKAAEAINERQSWQMHMEDCLAQERDEIHSKRTRAQMNLHFLKHQIQMGEDRKKDQRREDIEAASAHEFPDFGQANESGSKEFIQGQQARLRADLDEQVRTNNTLRNLQKQRERSLEMNQLTANRQEMAMLRNAERAKKVYDREALATAWNSEIRMKNIWKAIENHNKVGSHAGSSHAPQVLLTDGLPPPSRGGQSVQSAGRLLTGSSRRVPLGASSSLGRLESGR